MQKKENCEILKLNNRDSSVICMYNKKSFTDGGNPKKKCNFLATCHFNKDTSFTNEIFFFTYHIEFFFE